MTNSDTLRKCQPYLKGIFLLFSNVWIFCFVEVLNCSNFDLNSIKTPVNAEKLRQYLQEAKYPTGEINYLYSGFTEGFRIQYKGRQDVNQTAPNLKLIVGDKVDLWNKIMKEVREGRYAGPYEKVPFKHYIQSPLGLVSKVGGDGMRLIFHLSYPRLKSKNPSEQRSVNANTPPELCTVEYPTIERAIELCLKMGIACGLAKSDLKSAFRILGIHPDDWPWLVMMAISPLDGRKYFFVDKCLPFGAAISCAIFQRFSNALAHIIEFKTGRFNINYLDDFLFIAYMIEVCNSDLNIFLKVCQEICFPVSPEKTEAATTLITFLGYLLDTKRQLVYVPRSKIQRALDMINTILEKGKTTQKEAQKLCGLLNFFGKCIVPGRAFTRRLYTLTKKVAKPHHHITLKKENKMDLTTWSLFLQHPAAFSRPFADFSDEVVDIDMYTDSSRSESLGCGGFSGRSWFSMQWDREFIELFNPSIAYLELYAVTIAVLNWIHRYQNKEGGGSFL